MKALQHNSNVIKLIDNDQALYIKQNKSKLVNYLVFELASGGELFEMISKTGRFDENLGRYYFRKMVGAVDYCHKQGVTHRDLKLENMMLDQNWDLKLIDFGLAAPTQGRDGSGLLKSTVGTYGFMAPE